MATARGNQLADRRADEDYIRSVRAAMAAAEVTRERLAEHLGMSRQTLRNRMANPETFTRGEDRRLRRFLGMGDAT